MSIPIRVDAWSPDKSVRIVDTLLFDSSVWPLPLQYTSSSTLSASLEANAQWLADTILSDAEVSGMGRTVRHFTARVDLWSHGLQRTIVDQIREQLWAILRGTHCKPSRNEQALVPIRVRLSAYGVRVQDDFQIDANNPLVEPLAIAKSLGEELLLPDELVTALAIDIAEQQHGLVVDEDQPKEDTDGLAAECRHATAAWMLEERAHISNVAHLVQQHRPENTTTSSSI